MTKRESRLVEGTLAMKHHGHRLSAKEVVGVIELVGSCKGLSRAELAHTVCEHLNWVTITGRHKMTACMSLLEKLEGEGRLRLPEKRRYKQRAEPSLEWSERTQPGAEMVGELCTVMPVRLELASGRVQNALWNEYVSRYHRLGYRRPFGCVLRYFVMGAPGELGCLLVSGGSLKLALREEWIGWSEGQRRKNLPYVLNNSRFLIFPWVKVRHLASHVLGQLCRRVRADYEREWGYSPVLLETFVDPEHFSGTSYKASGWTLLGSTSGEGLARPGREYETTPKLLFVKPLVEHFRELLCSNQLWRGATDEQEDEAGETTYRAGQGGT